MVIASEHLLFQSISCSESRPGIRRTSPLIKNRRTTHPVQRIPGVDYVTLKSSGSWSNLRFEHVPTTSFNLINSWTFTCHFNFLLVFKSANEIPELISNLKTKFQSFQNFRQFENKPLLLPKIFPPALAHVRVHFRLFNLLVTQFTWIFGSVGTGVSGVQPMHGDNS